MYMGVVLNGLSGTNGTTGVEGLEVMMIIETLKTLQQTFITKSPISRSNTPFILNSLALSVNVVVDTATSSPLINYSTKSCRKVNLSSSSNLATGGDLLVLWFCQNPF